MGKRYVVYKQDNAIFIEDLQNENGHLLPAIFTHVEGAQKVADRLNAQADDIATLRAALEPFAKFYEANKVKMRGMSTAADFRAEDFKAAADTLGKGG